jgi:hypothetical protein
MTFDGGLSGAANYTESLRLLAVAADRTEEAMGMNPGPQRDLCVDLAQIYVQAAAAHAKLAVAAAAALHHVGDSVMEIEKDAQEWAVAMGCVEKAPAAWSMSVTETASLDRAMDIADDDRRDQDAERVDW